MGTRTDETQMNDQALEPKHLALEERSRALFHASVDNVDMAMRSRLTQARYAALEAAGRSGRRSWLARMPVLAPAAGDHTPMRANHGRRLEAAASIAALRA